MSIQGINPGYSNPALVPGLARPRVAEDAAPQKVQRPEAQAASARATSGAGNTVPTEPPTGTDPALWSVLTSEERSFFARARAMGPLTYGRGSAADQIPGVRLGGRIDVKV